MKTEILYEDEHIIVAVKPSGLATQSGKVGQPDMVSELKKHLASQTPGKAPYLGVVHRLDQPVEGLLVFAKDNKTAAALTKQLSVGSLHKTYYAVLCGQPEKKEDCLVDYLIKTQDNVAKVVEKSHSDAKKAVLRYQVLQTIDMPCALALAEIHIETGRFHQIRVQMSHAGYPLLGDVKYGTEETKTIGRSLSISAVGLCACSLEFTHPVSQERMHFEAKPSGKAFSFFSYDKAVHR